MEQWIGIVGRMNYFLLELNIDMISPSQISHYFERLDGEKRGTTWAPDSWYSQLAEIKAIYACKKVNPDRNKSKADHKVTRVTGDVQIVPYQ
jgi:hypothetical protein